MIVLLTKNEIFEFSRTLIKNRFHYNLIPSLICTQLKSQSKTYNQFRKMNRRGRSQNPNNQIQRMDNMMHDPFAQMHQMMRGFGGFSMMSRDDDMFGMMNRMHDPFQDMFKFSDIHQKMHEKGQSGSYVSQTFVSSSTMGKDGKIKSQNFYQNSMGQHTNGETISQKKQAYKNSDGVNRIAEQRMLNDKGRKIVKQKRGNDIEQTNHYYNMDQEDIQRFDNDWKGTNNKLKFTENHQKYIKNGYDGNNQNRMIGYQPRNQYGNGRRDPKLQRTNQVPEYERSDLGSRSSKQSGLTKNSKRF